jgi:hypothetical protein
MQGEDIMELTNGKFHAISYFTMQEEDISYRTNGNGYLCTS